MVSTSSGEELEETGFKKEDYCQCSSPVTRGDGSGGFADVGRRSTHCKRCGKFVLKRGSKLSSDGHR